MIIYFIEDKDTLELSNVKEMINHTESDEWNKILLNCNIELWNDDGYIWDNVHEDGGRYVEYILDSERYIESDISDLLKIISDKKSYLDMEAEYNSQDCPTTYGLSNGRRN